MITSTTNGYMQGKPNRVSKILLKHIKPLNRPYILRNSKALISIKHGTKLLDHKRFSDFIQIPTLTPFIYQLNQISNQFLYFRPPNQTEYQRYSPYKLNPWTSHVYLESAQFGLAWNKVQYSLIIVNFTVYTKNNPPWLFHQSKPQWRTSFTILDPPKSQKDILD